jgi:ABC-type protease/lipase transport system fused ATPase/permease subunit
MATNDTAFAAALRACRGQFLAVGLFSGAVNLLQLTIPLYMVQVFDRVLAARSADTLLWLTLVALAALLLLAVLEAVRGQVMARVAAWVEHRAAPEAFARAAEAGLRGGGHPAPLRAVTRSEQPSAQPSSSALASRRSSVSKPSVNHP